MDPKPELLGRCDTRSVFKRSSDGLNSEIFPSPWLVVYNLLIGKGVETHWFIDFVWGSVLAPDVDMKHLRKTEERIGGNVLNITIKIKTIVQILWMIRKASTHFKIKSISRKNYAKEINYKNFRIGGYFSITLYTDIIDDIHLYAIFSFILYFDFKCMESSNSSKPG